MQSRAGLLSVGDGSSGLDLLVFDEEGWLVASDVNLTDRCKVAWTPGSTGLFTITVVNHGEVRDLSTMRVN